VPTGVDDRGDRADDGLAMPEMSDSELEVLREEVTALVADLEKAAERLSEEEQEDYRAALQSVVDARRKAETHEGLLQVS
jgi:hypothetical protein